MKAITNKAKFLNNTQITFDWNPTYQAPDFSYQVTVLYWTARHVVYALPDGDLYVVSRKDFDEFFVGIERSRMPGQ